MIIMAMTPATKYGTLPPQDRGRGRQIEKSLITLYLVA